MRRAVGAAVALLMVLSSVPAVVVHATTSPRDGGPMPEWFNERLKEDRNFLQTQYGWKNKVARAKAAREAFIQDRGFYNMDLVAPEQRQAMSVTGTVRVPVFCSKFANTGSNPWTIASFQQKLYDGPSGTTAIPQTITEYYDEISYSNVVLTGTVYGWTQLANNDTYYEGPSGCNGLCGSSKLGDFINETLGANDGAVDFGQYDNDGPDNIPNSGDDDGFVDFVAFVHPEVGAECGGTAINIWSHRWVISGWLGSPWTSNDPATGGGFIRLQDYVMQPALNCDGTTQIDIGVFAHEYGHAFGLPDIYDTNGGSAGVGEWGLMGSGSWNSPDWPAHMCTWSKEELGWTNVVEVGSKASAYNITNIEQNSTAYRLPVMDERWRRMTTCAIAGTSMRCGLTASEAAARNYAGGEGYGEGWDAAVSREFSYSGSGTVSFQYDYDYDSEPGYDYTHVRIDVGGTVSTIVSYDGTGSGSANHNITAFLPASPTTYRLIFDFESDIAWSDRDGLYSSTCGSFVFDNVSVTGGGESYATNFETREDGWCQDMTSPNEYFLVENRQPVSSDQFLWGSGGLVIWHVNQDLNIGQAGNQGGASNIQERLVMPEQADGFTHLQTNANRGDAGDPYPGSSSNTSFTNASTPNSRSSSNNTTHVEVTSIGANPANGGPMTATMRAGWPLPTLASCTPNTGDDDEVVAVQLSGTGMIKGAAVELFDGVNTVTGAVVQWHGKDLVDVSFDLNGATPGTYDLIYTNPGSGCVVKSGGFTINGTATAVGDVPGNTALRQNYPNPFNPVTIIPFDLKNNESVTLRVYDVSGQLIRTLVDGPLEASSHRVTWDGRNDQGASVASGVYFYKLVAGSFQDVRKLTLMK